MPPGQVPTGTRTELYVIQLGGNPRPTLAQHYYRGGGDRTESLRRTLKSLALPGQLVTQQRPSGSNPSGHRLELPKLARLKDLGRGASSFPLPFYPNLSTSSFSLAPWIRTDCRAGNERGRWALGAGRWTLGAGWSPWLTAALSLFVSPVLVPRNNGVNHIPSPRLVQAQGPNNAMAIPSSSEMWEKTCFYSVPYAPYHGHFGHINGYQSDRRKLVVIVSCLRCNPHMLCTHCYIYFVSRSELQPVGVNRSFIASHHSN